MDVLDFFFPPNCLKCGKSGCYMCLSCLRKVEKASFITKNTYALWKYEGVVRKAIIALKYKFAYKLSSELACLISEELKARKIFLNRNIILVPVPLHQKRKKWRGFNQAEIVGSEVAKLLEWEYENNLVTRKDDRVAQVGLSKEKRLTNLEGAFEVNNTVKIDTAKVYVVFDDVWTTGATVREITSILEKSGVVHIFSLTVAR